MRLSSPFAPTLQRHFVARLRAAACRPAGLGQNHRLLADVPFLDDNTRNLVSRALEQDREAIDLLFQRYRDRLRAALRKLIGPKYRLLLADSEDATQDAILSALRRLFIEAYLAAAGTMEGSAPLFRTMQGRANTFTENAMSGEDILAMFKRRLKAAGLPDA